MKIVRTFDAIALLREPHLGIFFYSNGHIIAQEVGKVVTPVIYPRLAWRYLGVQAHPEEGIAIALYAPKGYQPAAPGEPGFFYWDGTHWLPTAEAVYQSPQTVRDGMEFWVGAVQFHVQIQEGRSLKELTVGYEANIQLIEYVFDFAIPEWLSQPYGLSRIVRLGLDGAADIPKGYNAEQILEASICPLEGRPVKAIAQGSKIRPQTENRLPSQAAQLLFTVKPQVEFTEGMYQVEQSPCIVLRELDIRQYHAPYRYEPVLSKGTESELDFPVADFDLPVEVSVMAAERADAQAIASQIMHKVRDEGKLYLPPVDLTLGCYVEGGIGAGGGSDAIPLELEGGMGVSAPSNTRGGLPTVIFRLVLKGLAN